MNALCIRHGHLLLFCFACVFYGSVTDHAGAAQPEQVSPAQLRERAIALEKTRAELGKKQMELLVKQLELATRRLELMQKGPADKEAVTAFAAIVEFKIAELQLRRAAERARTALDGARLVAADGQFLGKLAPPYDPDSVFCSYGDYGASYSNKSIWCTYGTYGATYQELSPFCSYSFKPPKLKSAEKEIAAVTVNPLAEPISLSPEQLQFIYDIKVDRK
jgi:hypothetical protein